MEENPHILDVHFQMWLSSEHVAKYGRVLFDIEKVYLRF